MLRVIREAKPTWIIGENVAGIVNLALDQVCTDLEAEGYEVEPIIIPACAVDAPHKRDRVWIIARDMADTISQRRCGGDTEGQYAEDAWQSSSGAGGNARRVEGWLSEPDVGRVAHGIPNRVHRLKGLGNAIVPQVAAEIIRCINKVMEDKE
jgi:DNA (cytosine-5)-methyltransferase 1